MSDINEPTMPAIPEAAVEAAAIALWNRDGGGPDPAPGYIRHDAYATLAAALPHLAPPTDTASATHRHKKRGTEYVLLYYGRMQAEDWHEWDVEHDGENNRVNTILGPSVDMREVAIYRSVTDPTEIWVRPREEFEDGRFEVLK